MSVDLTSDQSLVSFRISGDRSAARSQFLSYLSGWGLAYHLSRSSLFIFVPPPPPKPPTPMTVKVLFPSFRSPRFLASALSPLFPDAHFSQSRSSSPSPSSSLVSSSSGSSPAFSSASSSSLVVRLPPSEVSSLVSSFHALDVPAAEVVVRAAVFEVDKNSSSASLFSMMTSLLRSQLSLSISLPSSLAAGSGGVLSFSSGSFSAVVQALSTSSVFHVVTAPTLRVESGTPASFQVGQKVPTLASVSYTGASGTPVQSVQYMSSGVLFSVLPVVLPHRISLGLYQEISSFQPTTNGVNNSPTLQNRSLVDQLSVGSDSVIALGGLIQSNRSKSSSGFSFLPWSLGHDRSKQSTELLILLQVSKVSP